MFTYARPEEVGISSGAVKRYIEVLEKANLSTHDVIIARGDKIIYENYWAPFEKSFCHRMYSVTKSFVSLAIGFLLQDGKISLEDKIVDLFPEAITEGANDEIRKQTIRNMLMMSTGRCENDAYFSRRPKDRVRDYFEFGGKAIKGAGTFFDYDSPGSFILGALAERITGMTLLEYLREKLFDKIGVSDSPYMLKCPGGHSWSDSALLCTPEDLLRVAKFTMNLGKWNGEQILDEQYLKEATSHLISTGCEWPHLQGYGYQIWTLQQNSFFFNGMGCQLAVCIPHKDIILIYNGDNQGLSFAKSVIVDSFFDIISDRAADGALDADDEAYRELCDYSAALELWHCGSGERSAAEKGINGKCFEMSDNPMGIKNIRFSFGDGDGVMEYENEQGKKSLPFGFGKNIFGEFPQTGYSKDVGSVSCPGHKYRCAASGEWQTENMLYISVQIIDEYFGRLHMYFSFGDEGRLAVRMKKTAEDFLYEYEGYGEGTAK